MVKLLCCYLFGCKSTTDIDIVIRKSIRKNVKKGATIERVDEIIRKKFGENSIDYKELDYWYHQFYIGKRGLKDKRSPDDSPRKLQDLPNEMITEIISKLLISQRLDLAKVSIVFRMPQTSAPIFLILSEDSTKLCFEKTFVDCVSLPTNTAFKELRNIMNNPKLRLEQLICNAETHIETNEQQAKQLQRMLQSLDQQVDTMTLLINMFHLKDLQLFLPYMKPGILKVIFIYQSRLEEAEQVNESVPFLETIQRLQEFEQWNQVTWLDFDAKYHLPLVTSPVEHFFHLEILWFTGPIWDKFDMILSWISELLTKSPKIQTLVAKHFALRFREICSFISSDVVISETDEFAGIAIFMIPDTDKIFKISRSWKQDGRNVTELIFEKHGAPSHLIYSGQLFLPISVFEFSIYY